MISFSNVENAVFFEMVVSANQPFADNTKIHLAAIGSMGTEIERNVSFVSVGFIGAYPYGLTKGVFIGGSPMAGINLQPVFEIPNGTRHPIFGFGGLNLVGEETDIEFRSSGEFSPTIQISFENQSEPITYTYQNYKLPIESSAVLRQSQINYAVGVVTFGGFLFVVLDVIPWYRRRNA